MLEVFPIAYTGRFREPVKAENVLGKLRMSFPYFMVRTNVKVMEHLYIPFDPDELNSKRLNKSINKLKISYDSKQSLYQVRLITFQINLNLRLYHLLVLPKVHGD